MKKKIAVLMTLIMLFSILMVSVYAAEFPDVPADHWAHEYIATLSDQKVINGYTDGTFKPSGTVKRGEFLKLVMSSCLPPYVDISEAEGTMDHWAASYVWLAETYGVIEKNSMTIENIEEPITRIEMVRIISMADMIMKENASQFNAETKFIDVGLLSLNDLYLLRHAVSRSLITGYEDGTFKPEKTMSRAEAATMIYRFTK